MSIPLDKKSISDEQDRLARRSRIGQTMMLGTNVAVGFIVFTLIGYYVDRKFETAPLWTIVGMVTGFIFAGYEFWKTIRDIQNDETSSKSPKSGTNTVKKV